MSRFTSVTLVLGVAAGLLLGGCSSPPPLPPVTAFPSLPASTPQQIPPAYTIGSKDILSITVYNHHDLTKYIGSLHGQQVRVVGDVKTPGIYALRPASTLLEMFGDARGPTANVSLEVIVVRGQTQENDQRDRVGLDGTRSL